MFFTTVSTTFEATITENVNKCHSLINSLPKATKFSAATARRVECLMSMMTSSNGNILRITGHLCGEFTGPRWIPRPKASDTELWCFLWSALEINGWVHNGEAGDLRRHRAHYDVTVMSAWHIHVHDDVIKCVPFTHDCPFFREITDEFWSLMCSLSLVAMRR